MEKPLSILNMKLARLRAGRSNPALLDGITVDYYWVNSPLTQVSNINTPIPKQFLYNPWEKKRYAPRIIEKAIMAANISGLTLLIMVKLSHKYKYLLLQKKERHQLVQTGQE